MKEFNISLQYLDPKFYKNENMTGFLSEWKYSRRLENESVQINTLNEISENFGMGSKLDPLKICDHAHFDPLYQLCSKFNLINVKQKEKITLLLSSSIAALLPLISNANSEEKIVYRNTIKMLTFLCCMIINVSEKAEDKKFAGWNWDFEKENLTGVLISVLHNKHVNSLWNFNTAEEAYGNMFFKTAITMFESKNLTKVFSSILFKMIALNLKQNRYLFLTFSATFTHMLQTKEKFNVKAAELCCFLVEKHDLNVIVGNIVREISRINDYNLAKNNKGAENIGQFLKNLAENLPVLIYDEIDCLFKFLEGPSYKMRNGVLELIGEIIINMDLIIDKKIENYKAKYLENDDKKNKEFEDKIAKKRDYYYKQMGKFLDLVEERTYDVISFTRVKAISVLKRLIEEQAMPSSDFLINVIKICRNSIKEKNSNVRKNAASLLTLTVEKNFPVNPKNFKSKLIKLNEIFNIVNSAEAAAKNFNEKENIEDNKNLNISHKISENSREKLMAEHASVKKACEFIEQVEKCIPVVSKTLVSRGNFDVLECINFFKVASKLSIEGWKEGFKKMFLLIWNKDNSRVVDSVVKTFYEKYVDIKESDEPISKNKSVANNLAILISEMETYKELECIQEIILLMSRKDLIPSPVINSLFKIFKSQSKFLLDEISNNEKNNDNLDDINQKNLKKVCNLANNSIYILSVIAINKPEELINYIKPMIEILKKSLIDQSEIFVNRLSEFYLAIKHFLLIVDRCCVNKKTKEYIGELENMSKFIIFNKIIPENYWYVLSQRALNALFKISSTPEILVEQYLLEFYSTGDMNDEIILSKFLFLLGAVSIRILVRLEIQENKLKSLKSLKDKIENAIESKNKRINQSTISDYYKMNEGEKEYRIEQMREKAELNLVESDLIGQFGALVEHVCLNINQTNNNYLKCSAVLTLCKFMCVSKEYCIRNLNLLFSLLEEVKDSVLLINIIISMGDIAFRFPNVTAPHISKIFSPLKHKDMSVRKNSLLVISHLILNDMIKVKESISEIALAITDEEKSIRDLSKLFFQEFSKKGKNPVYNVLPDIISKLTHDNVEKTTFENIIKELIKYIPEEKQQINLIMKICTRFSKLEDKEQIQNNAYCLTLINYSEKCIKKIIECAKTYQNLLGDEKIFKYFKIILSKCKKGANKIEIKDMVNEYEKNVINKNPEIRNENSDENSQIEE